MSREVLWWETTACNAKNAKKHPNPNTILHSQLSLARLCFWEDMQINASSIWKKNWMNCSMDGRVDWQTNKYTNGLQHFRFMCYGHLFGHLNNNQTVSGPESPFQPQIVRRPTVCALGYGVSSLGWAVPRGKHQRVDVHPSNDRVRSTNTAWPPKKWKNIRTCETKFKIRQLKKIQA